MNEQRFFVRSGSCPVPPATMIPDYAKRNIVCIDGSVIHGSFFGCVEWLVRDFQTDDLVSHKSGELHMFVGGNPKKPESLNGVIDFQIENDHLVFDETSFVYVPAGCAHQIAALRELKQPMLHYIMHMDASYYESTPAQAEIPVGCYKSNRISGYAPIDGKIPEAPEGFLTFLLWIDGQKLTGAPYTESVWFHTTNDTGPEPHSHLALDEFVAFIGSDPEHPEELNGDISFRVENNTIHTRKSTIVYIPRGISHSPLLVHELNQDILHFSGGNSGSYQREPDES